MITELGLMIELRLQALIECADEKVELAGTEVLIRQLLKWRPVIVVIAASTLSWKAPKQTSMLAINVIERTEATEGRKGNPQSRQM